MPEPRFRTLSDYTADFVWPSGQHVRDQARRQARRSRTVRATVSGVALASFAAAAVFALDNRGASILGPDSPATSGPSATASATPSTTPSATPTATPSATSTRPGLTTVPPGALLQPSDVGPTTRRTTSQDGPGDWDLGFTLQWCATWRGGADEPRQIDHRFETTGGGDHAVMQDVRLYPAGKAIDVYRSRRTAVLACVSIRDSETGTETRLRIVAEGFAGQQSMTVEVTAGSSRSRWSFVLQDDMMSELRITPESDTTRLAERAAARMCAAQGTCS